MKTLALFLVLVAPVFGRLGETIAEAKSRYGEPVSVVEKENGMVFKKAGFVVSCQFFEGKVGMILIVKESKPGSFEGNPEISEGEIKALLTANGAGGEWVDTTAQFEYVNQFWTNAEAKRAAIYNRVNHTFTAVTEAHLARNRKEAEAKEKTALEDF